MYNIPIFYFFWFSYYIHIKLQARYNNFRMVSYSVQVLKQKFQ